MHVRYGQSSAERLPLCGAEEDKSSTVWLEFVFKLIYLTLYTLSIISSQFKNPQKVMGVQGSYLLLRTD